MRKVAIMAATGAVAVAAGGMAAHMLGNDPDRPDCPGRIVCPITGDTICADQCPLEAQAREVSLPVTEAPLRPCCTGKTEER
jgi:hypothetical protein